MDKRRINNSDLKKKGGYKMNKREEAEKFLTDYLRVTYKKRPKEVVKRIIEDTMSKEVMKNLVEEIMEWDIIPDSAEKYSEGI